MMVFGKMDMPERIGKKGLCAGLMEGVVLLQRD